MSTGPDRPGRGLLPTPLVPFAREHTRESGTRRQALTQQDRGFDDLRAIRPPQAVGKEELPQGLVQQAGTEGGEIAGQRQAPGGRLTRTGGRRLGWDQGWPERHDLLVEGRERQVLLQAGEEEGLGRFIPGSGTGQDAERISRGGQGTGEGQWKVASDPIHARHEQVSPGRLTGGTRRQGKAPDRADEIGLEPAFAQLVPAVRDRFLEPAVPGSHEGGG